MEKIKSIAELKALISSLEIKQAHEGQLLKSEFRGVYENLQPLNLIKNTFQQLTARTESNENLLNTSISLAAGYLSKKAAVGSTHNPIKQVLGTFLEIGVMNFVSKHSAGIQSVVLYLAKNIFRKKKTPA